MPLRKPTRPRAVVLATTVVASAALLAPPLLPAAAAQRVASVVELRLSPSQAIAGERVDLRVTVTPAVVRTVVLQRRAGDGWVEVTRGLTNASGVETFTREAPSASTTYRVRAPRTVRGGRTYAADVSPSRTLTVQRQEVFLRLPASATAGSVVSAVVECFPRRAGRPVVLWQRLGDGAWQSVASGVQGGQGIVTFQVPLPEEGVYQHRAVVAAEDGAAETRSAVRHVTVTAEP